MPTVVSTLALFPQLTPESVLAFQFSSWYPRFSSLSIKSTIIRPLGQDFLDYLDSDGVFLPEGAEDVSVTLVRSCRPAESTLSDDEGDEEEEDEAEDERQKFAFPELDAQIRDAVEKYGAVFPKLNFSSPRDAAWMLPASSPMKCTSPADVYLLLKSSDFVEHDLSTEHVFDGCEPQSRTAGSDRAGPEYNIELVLRKWYPVDRSRELRCFVRQEKLLGISQRDPNYYDFWSESGTQSKVLDALTSYWESNIRGRWGESNGDYTFDLLLTRDLSRAHIVDFNPYAPRTDPLLFTYDELYALLLARTNSALDATPELRVVDSPSHPAATRNAPAHQHNMVPIEALAMSSGRSVEEFAGLWQEEMQKSMQGDDEE
ncbi:D123-domain-containing protein [Wolfiporia cocos MD-104 SS10]|uniref:D123-domain-containing protein n=1 Tax=Wolfiporia cocos (strain MD-104) TaxID=742152 RepID=A0A2H3JDD6_WOLCO|nr:D123-domain-containing protein [Wolfiporia cocos MD-104 SS10]